MRKRIRRRKAKSKSISLSGPSTSREPLIGKPLLLDGEDAAAYERFSALINATGGGPVTRTNKDMAGR